MIFNSYQNSYLVAAAQSKEASIRIGEPEFRLVEGLVQVDWIDTLPGS